MDPRIVERARQGDEVAFTRIAQAVQGRFLQVAYRILRDRALAEDATQAALVRVWRKLPRLKDPAKFEAWSYRLLVNVCYSEAKRRDRSSTLRLDDGDRPARDALGAVSDRDQLERAFVHLTLEQRAVVVLHHYLGFTVVEVADVLGIPQGTAASRLARAMSRLREAIVVEPEPAYATAERGPSA